MHDDAAPISGHHPAFGGLSVADECEAFLRGGFAGLRISQGLPLPSWVAVNRIGHATLEELYELATGVAEPSPWFEAEQHVAARLLELAGDEPGVDHRVRVLQRRAIVPLELWLAGPGRSAELGPNAALALADESLVELGAAGRDSDR